MPDRKLPVDTSTGLVTLTCDHTLIYRPAPPSPGEEVYCRYCQNYRTVKAVTTQISVRCQQCKYSRRMGVGGESSLSLSDALTAASGHVTRNADHAVAVTDTDGSVRMVSHEDQDELPFAGLVTDRNAGNRAHQNMLRTVFNRSESPVEPRSEVT